MPVMFDDTATRLAQAVKKQRKPYSPRDAQGNLVPPPPDATPEEWAAYGVEHAKGAQARDLAKGQIDSIGGPTIQAGQVSFLGKPQAGTSFLPNAQTDPNFTLPDTRTTAANLQKALNNMSGLSPEARTSLQAMAGTPAPTPKPATAPTTTPGAAPADAAGVKPLNAANGPVDRIALGLMAGKSPDELAASENFTGMIHGARYENGRRIGGTTAVTPPPPAPGASPGTPPPAPGARSATPLAPPPAAPSPQAAAASPRSGGAPTASLSVQARPVSQRVLDATNTLRTLMGQAPLTAEQISQDQEYQERKRLIELERGQALAARKRELASRNQNPYRSTPAIQALESTAGDYDIRLAAAEADVRNSIEARRARQIAQAQDYLRSVQEQEGTAFSQGLAETQTFLPYTTPTVGQTMDQQRFEQTFAENQRQFGLQYAIQKAVNDMNTRQGEAGLTGIDPVTGRPTRATTEADRAFGLQEAGVTGTYQGAPTMAGQNSAVQREATQFDTERGRALLPSQIATAAAQASQSETQARAANEALYRDIEWFRQHPFEDRVLQQRVAAADAAIREEQAKAATDPTYGTSAVARANMQKIQAEMDAIKAEAAKRSRAGTQEDSLPSILDEVDAALGRGATYDQVVAVLTGGDSGLSADDRRKVLDYAKQRFGIGTDAQERTKALDAFTNAVYADKAAGESYAAAVQKLYGRVAAGEKINVAQGLDIIDKAFGEGQYKPKDDAMARLLERLGAQQK